MADQDRPGDKMAKHSVFIMVLVADRAECAGAGSGGWRPACTVDAMGMHGRRATGGPWALRCLLIALGRGVPPPKPMLAAYLLPLRQTQRAHRRGCVGWAAMTPGGSVSWLVQRFVKPQECGCRCPRRSPVRLDGVEGAATITYWGLDIAAPPVIAPGGGLGRDHPGYKGDWHMPRAGGEKQQLTARSRRTGQEKSIHA